MSPRGTKTGAALVSVASNTILIVVKVAAGLMTGSIAILTEAIHSAVDLLASLVALFSVRKADEPADGWDVADDLEEGWEPEALRKAAVAVTLKPAEKPQYLSSGAFKMGPRGLYFEAGEGEKSFVHGGQVDGHLGAQWLAGFAAHEELHTQVGRLADRVRGLGRGDEGFGGDDIRYHGGTADTDAFNEGDIGTLLCSGEGRFVSARPTA